MKFLSEYAQFPGKCFFSGSSDTSHGVLDTGHHVDYEGAVYMSGKLVEEAAGLIGWVSPEKYAEILAERDALKRQLNEVEAVAEAGDELYTVARSTVGLIDNLRSAVA